ncbi:MAG: DUF2065 domain-containing protein [Desulfobacterales bacterium]
MKDFLCVLGLVLVVEGLPYFASPAAMKRWLLRLLEVPDERLRWLGLAFMAAGVALVGWGRSG